MNDETKLWYMPWDCNAWTGSTGSMSAEQCGIHFNMLNHSWMNNAIKDDESLVWIAHAPLDLCRAVLASKWIKGKDGWTNKRLEMERIKAKNRSSSGKQAANKRWAQPCETDAKAHAEPMRNGMPDSCETDGSNSNSNSNTHTQNDTNTKTQSTDSLDTRKKRGRRQVDPDALHWSIFDGWQRTEQHRDMWAAAYPAVDIDLALAQAHAWLIGNPTKAHKSNWVRFVTTWMSKDQDRGGGRSSSAGGSKGYERYEEPTRSNL